MKTIIINLERKTTNFKELIQEALNHNFLDILVSKEVFQEISQLERLITYSKDLTLPVNNFIFSDIDKVKRFNPKSESNPANIGIYRELITKDDEKTIIELTETNLYDFIIVAAKDWKVIPYENLIAAMHSTDTKLIAEVCSIKEAELMLNVLEMGVDGILYTPKDADELEELKKITKSSVKINLTTAKVMDIQNISESARVCVDTTSLLEIGEGMLIGSTAKGFVLIHAEVFDTKFISSRPFRVNAGDVSAYILVPSSGSQGYRTKYLSELKGGDQVLIINTDGLTRVVTVARVKIEIRPMLRFELVSSVDNSPVIMSVICQNAETIRLVDKNGKAISVVSVKEGDEILVHIGPGATHFGVPLKEKIIEK
ncbi:MAG: 3-dehydroquinate synthase II [Candidatus Lokiarchaeota archaeon]|nr:3-dehydroquinate synthase II [Candidatus Lokiarchaeota archaeon]